MKTLLIDDLREINADVIARTFDAGIRALKVLGPFDILYLDHDLGHVDAMDGSEYWTTVDDSRVPMNGYGIICWLEANPEFLPKEIKLVTSNPVGRKNMEVVIKRLYQK